MAATYKAIGWNRHKRIYDGMVIGLVALFLGAHIGLGSLWAPTNANTSPEIAIIGALGACAFLMLHVLLCIGPLARLWPVFLPLLYNRRHFGVMLFVVAFAHAAFATIWYHAFGVVNPIISILTIDAQESGLFGLSFEAFGAIALVVLFQMAATSHDFWLNNLSPRVWKSLHMLVYVAYAALVVHVFAGVGRESGLPGIADILTLGGFAVVAGLHLAAGIKAQRDDAGSDRLVKDGWIEVGALTSIELNRARIISPPNAEKIAVFRTSNGVSAVSNVCRHQMGPLGEGKIVDGCITCPWHGWQYHPDTGKSPPPFIERVAVYPAKVVGGVVFVNPVAQG